MRVRNSLYLLLLLLPATALAGIRELYTDKIDTAQKVNIVNENIKYLDANKKTETIYEQKVLAKVTFSAGTPSLAYSVGVTSVTDLGAGSTRINFSTPFRNGNYYALVTTQDNAGGESCSYDEATDSANSIDVICRALTVATDLNFFIVVFGNQ